MSQVAGKAYHPVNGSVEQVWEGFSWPCLLFGCFWYVAKGMWAWAVVSGVLAIVTFGLSWLVFPFFANAQHANWLMQQGYLNQEQWNKKNLSSDTTTSPKDRNEFFVAEELSKLAELRALGILSEAEFLKQKSKLLD